MKTLFLTPSVRQYRTGLVRFFLLFFFSLPLALEAQPVTAPATQRSDKESKAIESLRADITGMLEEPKIENAYMGIMVVSVDNGETLFQLNEKRSFLPASSHKILTAITALATLGPGFRYTTELVTNGTISGKTLKGDLIIHGSGDPTLGSPSMFANDEPTFVFQQWADSLDKRGIEKIEGSIIADDSYFNGELYPIGWSLEDAPYGFAAPSSGLSFAENMVSVSVSPNVRNGSRPFVAIIPETDYFEKTNLATTTAKDPQEPLVIKRSQGTSTITVEGNIQIGMPAALEQISVEEPPIFAATTFRNVLEQDGFRITGGTLGTDELREKIAYQKTRVLATTVSPPLAEIVKVMNKRSNNFYAEQLLRTVAKEASGIGSWEEGIKAMKHQLHLAGIDTTFLTIHDGSGLSRMNLVSPEDFIIMLRTIYRNPELAKPFIESLPIVGVDGTLETRLVGTPAQGRIQAKTGSMTGVRTLVGYLTTKDGETLAFALLANNFSAPSREITNVQDLILLRLVNFSRK